MSTYVVAAPNVLDACKSDLKKFGCNATNAAQAQECIEKNEKEDQKNEGLTKDCYQAHEAFERQEEQEATKTTRSNQFQGAETILLPEITLALLISTQHYLSLFLPF